MKNLFYKIQAIIILSFCTLISYSQSSDKIVYYLNSKKTDMKNLFVNPDNIKSVDIKKEGFGSVFITTKKDSINFLTLNDILKKKTELNVSRGNVLIQINENIIEDISDIRIDDSYFVYVETKKFSEINYINSKFQDFILVKISLEKQDRSKRIIIRGIQDKMMSQGNVN